MAKKFRFRYIANYNLPDSSFFINVKTDIVYVQLPKIILVKTSLFGSYSFFSFNEMYLIGSTYRV